MIEFHIEDLELLDAMNTGCTNDGQGCKTNTNCVNTACGGSTNYQPCRNVGGMCSGSADIPPPCGS
jgi:hypothetical protein